LAAQQAVQVVSCLWSVVTSRLLPFLIINRGIWATSLAGFSTHVLSVFVYPTFSKSAASPLHSHPGTVDPSILQAGKQNEAAGLSDLSSPGASNYSMQVRGRRRSAILMDKTVIPDATKSTKTLATSCYIIVCQHHEAAFDTGIHFSCACNPFGTRVLHSFTIMSPLTSFLSRR